MTDTYITRLTEVSERLIHNIAMMDIYAKFEIIARDEIDQALLHSDSMKALDRAAKRLNDAHIRNRKAAQSPPI